MTNREWLNILTDEELRDFLCNQMKQKIFDIEYDWGIDDVRRSYVSSSVGLLQWLKNEYMGDTK